MYFFIMIMFCMGFFSSCNSLKDMNFKLYYYKGDSIDEIKNSPEIAKKIEELIFETTEILKLLVSSERVEMIKSNETCIEVIFEKRIRVNSKKLGSFKIDRLLIPLSGDFIGTEKSPVITIFLGDKNYMSGPLRNYNGLEKLNQLRLIIEKIP